LNFQPVVLAGRRVRLTPLDSTHLDDLVAAASDDRIWVYLDEATPRTPEAVATLIREALDDQSAGRRLPFAVIEVQTGRAVGSTSFIDIRPADRGVEIGWTWLSPETWGAGLNLEAKYLMLCHAFEVQAAIRVAIKTDARNGRSIAAIERLGAVREGTWRNHRVLSTGEYRDSVFFSVIEAEWPAVREHLQRQLQGYVGGVPQGTT
jgi:RimJ/RimL family protein N-acetyltransferase